MPFESNIKIFAKKARKRIGGAEFDHIFESILCGDLSRVARDNVLCLDEFWVVKMLMS
jgi:hypothetical protein